MSNSCDVAQEQSTIAEDELGMGLQRRHSFLAPDENSSTGDDSIKGEQNGSTSSDCTSAGTVPRPLSSIGSSGGNSNQKYCANQNVPTNVTYTYQTPYVNTQPILQCQPGNYEPLQQGYAYQNVPMAVPSFGYAPVQVQTVPMNVPMSQTVQPQHVVYPAQQCQSVPQDVNAMHVSTTPVPYVIAPVSYPPQINLDAQQVSSVASSAVSTPVFSCYSSPGYAPAYGFINTPLLSSASCTPVQCPMVRTDLPPVLDLNYSASPFPQQISCNINMNPAPLSHRSGTVTPASVYSVASNSHVNQSQTSNNSLFHEQLVEKIEQTCLQDDEDIWYGNLDYEEYKEDGGSNLFITWSGPKDELVDKLRKFKLEVRDVLSTSDQSICNVIFDSHPIARKAFTMQHQIRLRIVPPKNSQRIWLRNPSPTFLVKFETKCRLVVRKGKAECHDVVGELLPGCLISADQLKGHRIRVVCCKGSFMFPGGKIVEMKGVPNASNEKRASLGWISYRCKQTNESFLIRRSWNNVGDYIFVE